MAFYKPDALPKHHFAARFDFDEGGGFDIQDGESLPFFDGQRPKIVTTSPGISLVLDQKNGRVDETLPQSEPNPRRKSGDAIPSTNATRLYGLKEVSGAKIWRRGTLRHIG